MFKFGVWDCGAGGAKHLHAWPQGTLEVGAGRTAGVLPKESFLIAIGIVACLEERKQANRPRPGAVAQ